MINQKSLGGGILNYIAFHFVLKPHVIKNKVRYHGIIERWTDKGLIPYDFEVHLYILPKKQLIIKNY
jgi:hypothetical protein